MVGIFSAVPAWRHRYWEIPGRFCAAQFPALQCCAGRGDHCGAAIPATPSVSGRTARTAVRTASGADNATRDFHKILCRKVELTPENTATCQGGVRVVLGNTVRRDCNDCRCEVSPSRPGCLELLCTSYQCLLFPLAVTVVNTTGLA